MCGIGGIINLDGAKIDHESLKKIEKALWLRGPDEGGIYISPSTHPMTGWNVGLVNRRLSIIDLHRGSQPMSNADGSVWIVYNGEIYNFQTLRQDLKCKGRQFRTHSDTEVVLQAYEEHGTDCVNFLEGMFAFAIWDATKGRLFLARDKMGIKPLYYLEMPNRFVFASELKVLLQAGLVEWQIDINALMEFLTFEFIPAPKTILTGVKKLPPGYRLVIDGKSSRCERYWTPVFEIKNRREDEWIEIIQNTLLEATRSHLVSDVPIGVLLSGGMDSSSILVLAHKLGHRQIKTFSLGFDEKGMSELEFARVMAQECGTEHHEMVVSAQTMQDMLPDLWRHMDEPLADASAIPTFLVSKLASNEVKVVLSGDGGDELFGGYKTYQAYKIARWYNRMPRSMRKLAAIGVNHIPSSSDQQSLIFKLKKFIRGVEFEPEFANTIWWGAYLPEESKQLLSEDISHAVDGHTGYEPIDLYLKDIDGMDGLNRIFYLDLKLYLQDNLLVKVDRMSMAHSLEVRVPFLDTKVVEMACQLPENFKIKGMKTKYILRRAMAPILPEIIRKRGKQGFDLPLGRWLRNDLKETIEDTLLSKNLRGAEFFNKVYIKDLLREHMSGQKNHRQLIWPIFVFLSWCQMHA
ncbi:MAG TPA: asparagine synthase (glutamine-hydrolyzing) [bacterium]|nr:asparagine synthase (glutamine-hydrolyzing) [bacterium]